MRALKVGGIILGSTVTAVALFVAAIAFISPQVEGTFATSIESEVVINAPPKVVWAVLGNFDSYPAWNPFIRKISGRLAVGDHLHIEITSSPDAAPLVFDPLVLEVTPDRGFKWRGKVLVPGVFDGTHRFRLTELPDGRTLFEQSEKFSGAIVPVFRGKMKSDTEGGFKAMNNAIKSRAEAITLTSLSN